MKNKTSFKWLIAFLVITIASIAQSTYAQVIVKTLPDGTVVYSDGTIQRPNGDVRNTRNTRNTRGTRLPDGSIRYPDGTIRYPDGTVRNPDGTIRNPNPRNRDGQRIPPGQAKKRDGAHDARDYAPGHNKMKNKNKGHRDNDEMDDDRNDNKDWKEKNKHDDDREDNDWKEKNKSKDWKNKSKGKNK